MPTYDYECGACGHHVEAFQAISEPARRKCPRCGKLRLRRLVGTGAAVIFKGSGFYTTDYKRSGSDVKQEKATNKDVAKAGGPPAATTPAEAGKKDKPAQDSKAAEA